jgi:hypothetical protein
MIRSSASLALALVAPLAFATGCAKAPSPANSPADYQDNRPPRGWRDPAVGKEMRSSSMVASGIVLISLGATVMPIGSLVSASARQDCTFDSFGNSQSCKPSSERLSGLGVLVAGAGGLAIGIPLLVLGAQKVPIEIPRRSALTVGPTGASFRYDF